MDAAQTGRRSGSKGSTLPPSASAARSDLRRLVCRRAAPAQARREEEHAERGADLHQSITVSFEDAMRGGQPVVTVTGRSTADLCKEPRPPQRRGNPVRALSRRRPSQVGAWPYGVLQAVHIAAARAAANALSDVRQAADRDAHRAAHPEGSAGCRGRRTHSRAGQGHAGRNGGAPGDLFVTVHVQPHPLFRREGDDLLVTVPIAVHEAALGQDRRPGP